MNFIHLMTLEKYSGKKLFLEFFVLLITATLLIFFISKQEKIENHNNSVTINPTPKAVTLTEVEDRLRDLSNDHKIEDSRFEEVRSSLKELNEKTAVEFTPEDISSNLSALNQNFAQ